MASDAVLNGIVRHLEDQQGTLKVLARTLDTMNSTMETMGKTIELLAAKVKELEASGPIHDGGATDGAEPAGSADAG